jgi:uncharacterized membrane protein (DUF485 family)
LTWREIVNGTEEHGLGVPASAGTQGSAAAAADLHGEEDGYAVVRVTEKPQSTPSTTVVKLTSRELLESKDFRHLVTRRWRVALLLTSALFVVYYGFILLVATQRGLLATRVGEVTTLGIVLGVAVLVLAWVLTATYVVWANRNYDPEVQRLRDRLRS